VFDSDVQDALFFLISSIDTKHDLFYFHLWANSRGGKDGTFVVGRWRHTLVIRHWVQHSSTLPPTPVSRLIAKRKSHTDHVLGNGGWHIWLPVIWQPY